MQIIIEGRQYEIVSNQQNPESLWVKAHRAKDLEELFPGVEPRSVLSSEFPYHVALPRIKVAQELARRVAGMVPGGIPTLCS